MNDKEALVSYELELNATDLFTLEQFCKEVRRCGTMDWGHAEFRAVVNVIPTNQASHAALQELVLKQNALGIAGLSVMSNPKIT